MNPLSTGSATLTNTIGIVEVAWRSAATPGLLCTNFRFQRDHLPAESGHLFRQCNLASIVRPKINMKVAACGPTQLLEPLLKRYSAGLFFILMRVAGFSR